MEQENKQPDGREGCPDNPLIEHVRGDLFAAGKEFSLCHCVSRDFAMGKGIATVFKSKFGSVEELLSQRVPVGGVGVLESEGRCIFYLVTKEKYWHKPTVSSLKQSLLSLREEMRKRGCKRLAMPRIGSGLDGLDWERDVLPLLSDLFTNDDNLSNLECVRVYQL